MQLQITASNKPETYSRNLMSGVPFYMSKNKQKKNFLNFLCNFTAFEKSNDGRSLTLKQISEKCGKNKFFSFKFLCYFNILSYLFFFFVN